MKRIKMIDCLICGNAVCHTIGFNCFTECEYNRDSDPSCLQRQYKNSCECSKSEIRESLMKKYDFGNRLSTKDMIREVSYILNGDFIDLFVDEDFDLQI